jgi:hypothetical protein
MLEKRAMSGKTTMSAGRVWAEKKPLNAPRRKPEITPFPTPPEIEI